MSGGMFGGGGTEFSASPGGPGLLNSPGTDAIMNAPMTNMSNGISMAPGGTMGDSASQWAAVAPVMGQAFQSIGRDVTKAGTPPDVRMPPMPEGYQISPNVWQEAFGPKPTNQSALQHAQALQQLAMNWGRR